MQTHGRQAAWSRADLRAHRLERTCNPSHRPATQAGIAVKTRIHVTRKHTHEQPHCRGGVSAINCGIWIAKRVAANDHVIIINAPHLNAELAQCTNSRNDIIADVGIDNARVASRNCRQYERPMTDRFVAWKRETGTPIRRLCQGQRLHVATFYRGAQEIRAPRAEAASVHAATNDAALCRLEGCERFGSDFCLRPRCLGRNRAHQQCGYDVPRLAALPRHVVSGPQWIGFLRMGSSRRRARPDHINLDHLCPRI